MTKHLELHPVAEIFPPMSADEYKQLVDDIRENGLLEPLWLAKDGRIIDGRHRYRACFDLSLDPSTRIHDGDDLVAFVVSLNLHRRHLSESQKQMVGARLATMSVGHPIAGIPAFSQNAAADLLGVDRDGITLARRVIANGTPSLAAAVDSGRVSVSAAAEVATRPKEEQVAILALDEKAIIKEANRIKRDRKAEVKRGKEAVAEVLTAQAREVPSIVDVRAGDFAEVLADLHDVDAIITDPPYPEEFLPLYQKLAEWAPNVLAPHGVLAVMVGQSYLPQLFGLLSGRLAYRWTLAYLTLGGQAVQVWPRKVNTFWKPVLLFGAARDWLGDVAKSDANDKRFHDWGQSVSGMVDLLERLTLPGHLVVDPFCGGGTTGVAATLLHRRFIGADIDQSHAVIARNRIQEASDGWQDAS